MAQQPIQHNETHNKTVLGVGMLEEGDLVEFDRGIITHWGVYVGGGEIIHLSVDDRSGTGSKKGCVTKENIWSVGEQSKVKKNNDKDRYKRPFCRVDIKKRALSKLGPSDYCVVTYNCEHFANWCRYGIQESTQVDTGVFIGGATGFLGIIGGVVLRIMGIFSSSSMKR